MEQKLFRPTLTSLAPHLAQGLLILAIAIGCWFIYFLLSSTLFAIFLAILFSLFAIWYLLTLFTIAAQRVSTTDLSIKVAVFASHRETYWENIEKVQIAGGRIHFLPARMDRMILVLSKGGDTMSFSFNAWPGDDDDCFLKVLHERASEHGFSIFTVTRRR